MATLALRSFALFRSTLARFAGDQGGATAIEYGLMTALIGIAILATVFSMGKGINTTLYGAIVNALSSMM